MYKVEAQGRGYNERDTCRVGALCRSPNARDYGGVRVPSTAYKERDTGGVGVQDRA